jgi:hypothetical protein
VITISKADSTFSSTIKVLAKQQSVAKKFFTLWAFRSHATASFVAFVTTMALARNFVVCCLYLSEPLMLAVS